MFSPYGIELICAKVYDPEEDDWACEEDFLPAQRECPNIEVDYYVEWENFLNSIVQILKELIIEFDYLEILNVEHITTGFCDGDLVDVK